MFSFPALIVVVVSVVAAVIVVVTAAAVFGLCSYSDQHCSLSSRGAPDALLFAATGSGALSLFG